MRKELEKTIIGEKVKSIKVVKNGREIISISEQDISCSGSGVFDEEPASICTISGTDSTDLLNYLLATKSNCIYD